MFQRTMLLLTTSLLSASEATNPSLIRESMVQPKYTDDARDARVSGSVLLKITIDAKGQPTDVAVVRALGYGLDESALEAVKQWRFRPATKDGKPVIFVANAEVSFRLTDSPPPERD